MCVNDLKGCIGSHKATESPYRHFKGHRYVRLWVMGLKWLYGQIMALVFYVLCECVDVLGCGL